MNTIFFRIHLILISLVTQCLLAQKYPGGVSDGTLDINGHNIPIKIYSTTEIGDLSTFPDREPDKSKSYIVIFNDLNFKHAYAYYNSFIASILDKYKDSQYQFLDKNFKLIDTPVTTENITSFKYAIKTVKPVTNSDKIELKTSFKIWDPSKEINIRSFTIHFYSLMFIFSFGLGYVLMTRIFKIDNVNKKYLEPLFTWTLIGTIIGARLGHVIFYQPELFKEDFWSVFFPISTKYGFKITGFSGLASHGATIALIFTTLYYSLKIIKKNPFWVYDRLGIVISLGGSFVRVGNFFNSEIIGKPADAKSPFAVLFLQQSSEYGPTVPRYPSQIFEAVGYLLLFFLLWILYRKTDKKYQQGWLFGLFFIILWAIRFFVEFLKEPQGDEFIQIGSLNTGQVLSIPFMITGVIIMIVSKKLKITQSENKKIE